MYVRNNNNIVQTQKNSPTEHRRIKSRQISSNGSLFLPPSCVDECCLALFLPPEAGEEEEEKEDDDGFSSSSTLMPLPPLSRLMLVLLPFGLLPLAQLPLAQLPLWPPRSTR
jgi:hypothetical protein